MFSLWRRVAVSSGQAQMNSEYCVAYFCMIKRAREVSKLSCLMTQEVIFNLEIQQTLMGIITFLELPLENEGQVLSILFP